MFATSARVRIQFDRGHSAATATTALFADLFGSLSDLMIDFFQLIEQFYRYLIRHETVRKVGVIRPRVETAGIAT